LAGFLFFTPRQIPKMTEPEPPRVKLCDKESFLDIESTQIVVKVYPSPDGLYFGHWHLDISGATADDDEVNIDELYALHEAIGAAYSEIKKLLEMIEEQDSE
jgi:hypothetical protein